MSCSQSHREDSEHKGDTQGFLGKVLSGRSKDLVILLEPTGEEDSEMDTYDAAATKRPRVLKACYSESSPWPRSSGSPGSFVEKPNLTRTPSLLNSKLHANKIPQVFCVQIKVGGALASVWRGSSLRSASSLLCDIDQVI